MARPLEVPRPQRVSDIIQFERILGRQVRRPVALIFDEAHVHLCDKITFAHELLRRTVAHVLLLFPDSSHFAGSGRYAVIRTAGDT